MAQSNNDKAKAASAFERITAALYEQKKISQPSKKTSEIKSIEDLVAIVDLIDAQESIAARFITAAGDDTTQAMDDFRAFCVIFDGWDFQTPADILDMEIATRILTECDNLSIGTKGKEAAVVELDPEDLSV